MTAEQMDNEVAKLKAERRELELSNMEADMDDAIILAYVSGVLTEPVTFDWRDLEVQ